MNGNRVRVFFDTNIIVYGYSDDDPVKKRKAVQTLNEYHSFISTQVLNEFCNVCIRDLERSESEIQECIDELQTICDLYITDANTVARALKIRARYRYSYYDCLILASALECGCAYLFSEDMRDGQVIAGMTIRNIFREAG
ncbi:MAG: PIN domain-containing protein [Spirochaetaceae bacterium]|jgi:predicted nucleic acid-binding protein|nr:PIN domain-containing protein [Spirochaetaceae bacterium]